ncbi:MAG: hypothetical protein ABIO46_05045 [Chitinophagales bacterium]
MVKVRLPDGQGKLQQAIKLKEATDRMYVVKVMVNEQSHYRRIVFDKQ